MQCNAVFFLSRFLCQRKSSFKVHESYFLQTKLRKFQTWFKTKLSSIKKFFVFVVIVVVSAFFFPSLFQKKIISSDKYRSFQSYYKVDSTQRPSFVVFTFIFILHFIMSVEKFFLLFENCQNSKYSTVEFQTKEKKKKTHSMGKPKVDS